MVNKFLVPAGFKDSLNFDASIEHKYKNSIINYFRDNGFTLIKTPLVEFSKNLDRNTLTLKTNKKIDSAFSVHIFYKHVWHKSGKKFVKVSKWMKSYTSRQTGQKLYREDTGLASATRSKFWRSGKRIGKKVKFIINDDAFTGIDIHSKKDLYLAEMAMRYAKKHNLIDH